MSDERSQWLTTREAAQLLKVTDRMVGHYAVQGKIRTRREGRRVWYYSEDVQKLAQSLRVDLRPQHITRDDVNQAMIDYVRNRQETDREVLDRLQRIEQRLDQPPAPTPQPQRGPSWQVVATLAIVLAILGIVLVIVLRFV